MAKRWTKKEIEYMHCFYAHNSSRIIAENLDRPIRSVYSQANVLGLRKSEKYLNSSESGRLQVGGDEGKRFRFKKGNVPFNKGI